MFGCLFFTLALRAPPPHHVLTAPAISGYDCNWEKIRDGKLAVMKKCFGVDMDPCLECELFCVDGVPTASMLYEKTSLSSGGPVVNAFHFQKGRLLMFDAGPHMRRQLFARYKKVCIEGALNKEDFLLL